MITTPEKTVHYPWEGDNIEFSMKSVHNNLVLLHHSMREWYIGLVGIHFCVIRGRGTKSKRIWGPVKPPHQCNALRRPGFRVADLITSFLNYIIIITLTWLRPRFSSNLMDRKTLTSILYSRRDIIFQNMSQRKMVDSGMLWRVIKVEFLTYPQNNLIR